MRVRTKVSSERPAIMGRSAVLMGAMLLAGPVAAQEITRPAEITPERVEQGFRLYHTKGACATCHGDLGTGTPDGPGLLTGQWKLGPGTYEWLQHITRHAGWGATFRNGDPQPMRGPTVLDPTEIGDVAAYVWSISRGRAVTANRQ
jgi:mono/diheme cytochrome c family protein